MFAKLADTARTKTITLERYNDLIIKEQNYDTIINALKLKDIKINYLLSLLEATEIKPHYIMTMVGDNLEVEPLVNDLQTISLDRHDELIRIESRYKMLLKALKQKDVKANYLLALFDENEEVKND